MKTHEKAKKGSPGHLTAKKAIELVCDNVKKRIKVIPFGYEMIPVAKRKGKIWVVYFEPGPNVKYLLDEKTQKITIEKQDIQELKTKGV